jgi:hypothetical protein
MDKSIEDLEKALLPFAWECSGVAFSWGAVLAWIKNGAPTEAEGIAAAKQIVKWQVAAQKLVSPPLIEIDDPAEARGLNT